MPGGRFRFAYDLVSATGTDLSTNRRGVLRRLPRDRNGVARCPHRATERVVTPPLGTTFNPELPARSGGRTGRRTIRPVVVCRVAHSGEPFTSLYPTFNSILQQNQ